MIAPNVNTKFCITVLYKISSLLNIQTLNFKQSTQYLSICKCTNSTEVKLKTLCIIVINLHFTITMNRTGNCHKNGVHNHGKEEEGVQHYRYECKFT